MPVLGFHTDGRRTKEMLKAGRARLDLTRQFVRGQEFWSLQTRSAIRLSGDLDPVATTPSEHAFASIPRPNQIEHDRVQADFVVTRARIRQEFVGYATPAKRRGEQFVGNERHRQVPLAVMYLIGRADGGNLGFRRRV